MEREVRYCTTDDGVRIAYCVEGAGPPLVAGQQLVESFSVDHIAEGFGDFYRALARRRTVIRYDLRGTGLSGRGQFDMSCESLVRDLEAVVRSLEAPSVSLLGDTRLGPTDVTVRLPSPRAGGPPRLVRSVRSRVRCHARDKPPGPRSVARSNWHFGAQAIADIAGRVQFAEATVAIAEIVSRIGKW